MYIHTYTDIYVYIGVGHSIFVCSRVEPVNSCPIKSHTSNNQPKKGSASSSMTTNLLKAIA